MRRIFLLSILFCFISCQNNKPILSEQEGFWQAIGYGRLLHISQDSYALYDTSSISCLPLHVGNLSDFGDNLTWKKDTLVQQKGTGIYKYVRLDELPKPCVTPLSESRKKDPLYNFEVFAETIANNYAYFEQNGINWDSIYQNTRSKISSISTEVDLYLAMEEIMTALKDNHGYVEPTDVIYEKATEINEDIEENSKIEVLPEYGDFQIAQMVSNAFLVEDLTKDSPLISWGKVKNNIGYIQVKSMWLYANLNLPDSLIQKNGYVSTYVDAFNQMNEGVYIEKERLGVSLVMDRVMKDLKSTDSLIIDVRFNGGGQDMVSMEILKRFNEERRKVATKKTKTLDGFTPEIPIWLEASDKPYTKPVFVLTSQQTASAADFFALASMELPNVVRIGSHSQGALSDALEKPLPNGWYFAISNEMYFDLDGICYESKGIPVHYELNYPEDRQSFFRSVASDLDLDKKNILNAIGKAKAEL